MKLTWTQSGRHRVRALRKVPRSRSHQHSLHRSAQMDHRARGFRRRSREIERSQARSTSRWHGWKSTKTMRRASRAVCSRLVVFAADPKLTPEMQAVTDRITADSLRGHLSFIASDALEGRAHTVARSGSRGRIHRGAVSPRRPGTRGRRRLFSNRDADGARTESGEFRVHGIRAGEDDSHSSQPKPRSSPTNRVQFDNVPIKLTTQRAFPSKAWIYRRLVNSAASASARSRERRAAPLEMRSPRLS